METERNCKTCLWNSMYHHGCCSWDCDYINRKEAAEAWREKHGMIKNCENCENMNEGVHSEACSGCTAGDGAPTKWKPQTDCGWK